MQEVLIAVACSSLILATADSSENQWDTNTVQPFQTGGFIRDEEEFHRLESPVGQVSVLLEDTRVLPSAVGARREQRLRRRCTCISPRLRSVAATDHSDANHTTSRPDRLARRSRSMRTTTKPREDWSSRTEWTSDWCDLTKILRPFSPSDRSATRRIGVSLKVESRCGEEKQRERDYLPRPRMFPEVFRAMSSTCSSHRTEHIPRSPRTRSKHPTLLTLDRRSSLLPKHRCRSSVVVRSSTSDGDLRRRVLPCSHLDSSFVGTTETNVRAMYWHTSV